MLLDPALTDFVSAVPSFAPERAPMLAYGLSDAEADELIAEYTCTPTGVRPDDTALPLARLICAFDCSRFQIGEFHFTKRAEPTHDGNETLVGFLEGDPVLESAALGVRCINHDDPSQTWRAAPDGAAFLLALALVAQLNVRASTPTERGALLDRIVGAVAIGAEPDFWRRVIRR